MEATFNRRPCLRRFPGVPSRQTTTIHPPRPMTTRSDWKSAPRSTPSWPATATRSARSWTAFVIAFRSLAGWRADGPFGAWLTRIAVRIALRRAQKRRDVAWIDPAHPERPLEVPGGVDPASSSLRAERAADVRAAVARHDEPYRETIAHRVFGDLSLDEIATQTGRPLGTVKTHLHRGLIRLRGVVDAGAL